jgi:hypothetical protein
MRKCLRINKLFIKKNKNEYFQWWFRWKFTWGEIKLNQNQWKAHFGVVLMHHFGLNDLFILHELRKMIDHEIILFSQKHKQEKWELVYWDYNPPKNGFSYRRGDLLGRLGRSWAAPNASNFPRNWRNVLGKLAVEDKHWVTSSTDQKKRTQVRRCKKIS